MWPEQVLPRLAARHSLRRSAPDGEDVRHRGIRGGREGRRPARATRRRHPGRDLRAGTTACTCASAPASMAAGSMDPVARAPLLLGNDVYGTDDGRSPGGGAADRSRARAAHRWPHSSPAPVAPCWRSLPATRRPRARPASWAGAPGDEAASPEPIPARADAPLPWTCAARHPGPQPRGGALDAPMVGFAERGPADPRLRAAAPATRRLRRPGRRSAGIRALQERGPPLGRASFGYLAGGPVPPLRSVADRQCVVRVVRHPLRSVVGDDQDQRVRVAQCLPDICAWPSPAP